jgi:hypothetical protein
VRRITLKFAGRCSTCGRVLEPGDPAWWDPATREVRCTASHDPGAPPLSSAVASRPGSEGLPADPSGAVPRRDSASTPDGEQGDWVRLVRYLRRCVEREAAGELIALDRSDRYSVLPTDGALLVCGAAQSAPPNEAVYRIGRALQGGETLICGWPTLVVRHAPRRGDPMYFVYENWTNTFCRVHEESCSFCNRRKGLFGGRKTPNGQWHSGFRTLDAALRRAE